MSRRLLMTVLSASCLMAVVFLARGFDVQLGWHANDAQAIDLFGSKEEAPAAQPDTIGLAPALLAGMARSRPWGAMRIEVLRHVVALQPGGRWRFDLDVAAA